MIDYQKNQGKTLSQRIGAFLGPICFMLMLSSEVPAGLEKEGWFTAAIAVLMAIWWATEAMPIAVTALLPIVLFPTFGVTSIEETAPLYANKVIFLFLGGFIVAFAMQRWNLHRRMALKILQYGSNNGRSLVASFMIASALISMWVMNTSTTMMLLPIAISVITVVHNTVTNLSKKNKEDFQYSLLLGVAYGSTIGGMATLVGTAPNVMLAAFMLDNYDFNINFADWMIIGLPLTALMLPLAWITLTKWVFKVDFTIPSEGKATLQKLRIEMGSISTPEIRVAVIFLFMASCWILRPILIKLPGLAALDDSLIAIGGAILLFITPSGDKSDPILLRWKYAEKLPWGVLILLGGGLALANAVSSTGLAKWIGGTLNDASSLPLILLVFLAATLIIFLTELTSNVATTATFLPVVGAIAIESGYDPIVLVVPVTLAASCAFMLPVATPPNAIVFGSGMLNVPRMAKAGVLLNIIGIFIVTIVTYKLSPILIM